MHGVADRRAAAELKKQGLIAFEGDPANRRRKIVTLALKGRALMEYLRPGFRARRERINSAVGESVLPGLWEAIENLPGWINALGRQTGAEDTGPRRLLRYRTSSGLRL